MKKWTLHRVHKWTGIIAALWLAILGITGFLLDHRDSWAWLWQSGVATRYVPETTAGPAASAVFRIYQVRAKDPACHVTGGQHGLWWRSASGQDWQRFDFAGRTDSPQIYAAFFSNIDRQAVLWLATDTGVWRSRGCGRTAEPFALTDQRITDLTPGAGQHQLLGVADRSQVFRLGLMDAQVSWMTLSAMQEGQLPDSISLSRFVRDLHYGRGVFTAPLSLLWSDAAGIAMLVIPLSGILFFVLPHVWRQQKQQGKQVPARHKKQTMRWLYRVHAPLLGLLTFIPVIYLSLTGILLDHNDVLIGWMKQTRITSTWQTPVYRLQSLDAEIYSLDADPHQSGTFSIGTRLGLFTTRDNGQSWVREKLLGERSWFIWRLKRHGTELFLGGMGGPNLFRDDDHAPWQVVKGAGHMPSDVVKTGDQWLVLNRAGLRSGTVADGFQSLSHSFPKLDYVPWYYILDGLHSGLIIHKQWKWVNDLFAVLAILLVITGLLRWWRKKWI